MVTVNSILPDTRDDVAAMLATVAAHLDPDGGRFVAIMPAYDATRHLRRLWHDHTLATTGSPAEAERVAAAFHRQRHMDDTLLRYADDGASPQSYHTPDSLDRELTAAGLELLEEPAKVHYPWELARRFDYGWFPDADEEIWDWFVVARRRR
ncbi:MAG: hypothetical protein U5R31_04995 [Acidimicrobiia bacterium]|nr:hypothetical protein [Acidimicrobiia bacterium]